MVVLSLALAPIVSACGGGMAGAAAKVAPCGGDVIGNWTVSGACFNSAAVEHGHRDELPRRDHQRHGHSASAAA